MMAGGAGCRQSAMVSIVLEFAVQNMKGNDNEVVRNFYRPRAELVLGNV